jgi:hypothetical protein
MRKLILLFTLLLSLACASMLPTPDDFPPPPMTVIVEDFPTPFVTVTIEPRTALITSEKMQDAQSFHLILVTRVAAGDSTGIAEMVKYPITVNLDGSIVIANADEFEVYYDRIFTDDFIKVLMETNDDDLNLLFDGIRVGKGELWFNLFCVDMVCSDTQFLITQINSQE